MRHTVRVKSSVLTAALLPLLAAAALAGQTASENRQVGAFTAIEASGGYTIYLSQDSTVSLRLEGDKDDLAKVITKVENGKLIIKHKPCIRLFSFDKDDISVYVGFKDIKSIELAGSNKVVGQKPLRFKDLKLDVSGSGDIAMDLQAATIDADLSGSGDLKLKGAADALIVDISGSGDIKCLDLKAKKVELSISGSGDAAVDAADELKVDVSGSGDVKYRGNPAKVNQSVSGSGDIKKVE
ncbi:MAG TPA: head GIN domain-containing protein [Candidatus Edwardsbacteria bacterium]|nr:head GIN domain-containing protein [Candidatus Edwardsbacteria bacterium]